jgi:hypothetical protein
MPVGRILTMDEATSAFALCRISLFPFVSFVPEMASARKPSERSTCHFFVDSLNFSVDFPGRSKLIISNRNNTKAA